MDGWMNDTKHEETHAWFRAARPAYASRTLEEIEMRRFDQHLESCEECSEYLLAFAGEEGQEAGGERHLPAWLLVRWQDLAPRLGGLARAAVRAHLEGCTDCRADLEFVGNEPVLDVLPSGEVPLYVAESGDEAGRKPRSDEASAGSRIALAPPPRAARPIWTARRALAGWAVLSTAAALVLFVRGRAPQFEPLAVLPWVAPQLLRGDAPRAKLEVEAGTRRIAVAVPVPLRSGDVNGEVRVEVRSVDGTRLASDALTEDDLARGALVLLVDSPEPLSYGSYRVVFLFPSSAGPDSTESGFELSPIP